MSRLDDANNALGYIVVQLAAHASKAAEIAKNARKAHETASVFMQEQLRASQKQKQTIEKQEKELEKVKDVLGIALSKERVASETPAEPKPEKPASVRSQHLSLRSRYLRLRSQRRCLMKEEKPKEGAWSRTIDGEAERSLPILSGCGVSSTGRTTRLSGVLSNPVKSSNRGTSRSGSAIVARRPAGGTQSIASDP